MNVQLENSQTILISDQAFPVGRKKTMIFSILRAAKLAKGRGAVIAELCSEIKNPIRLSKPYVPGVIREKSG